MVRSILDSYDDAIRQYLMDDLRRRFKNLEMTIGSNHYDISYYDFSESIRITNGTNLIHIVVFDREVSIYYTSGPQPSQVVAKFNVDLAEPGFGSVANDVAVQLAKLGVKWQDVNVVKPWFID